MERSIERVEWRAGRSRVLQSVAVHVPGAVGAAILVPRWPALGCAALLTVIASAAWDVHVWRRARHIVRRVRRTRDGLRIDDEDVRIRSAWLGPHATVFWGDSVSAGRRRLWIHRDEVAADDYAMLRRYAKSLGAQSAQPATGRSTSSGSAKLG